MSTSYSDNFATWGCKRTHHELIPRRLAPSHRITQSPDSSWKTSHSHRPRHLFCFPTPSSLSTPQHAWRGTPPPLRRSLPAEITARSLLQTGGRQAQAPAIGFFAYSLYLSYIYIYPIIYIYVYLFVFIPNPVKRESTQDHVSDLKLEGE